MKRSAQVIVTAAFVLPVGVLLSFPTFYVLLGLLKVPTRLMPSPFALFFMAAFNGILLGQYWARFSAFVVGAAGIAFCPFLSGAS